MANVNYNTTANGNELDSTIQIDGTNYSVTAEKAKKVAQSLTIKTIKDGAVTEVQFDGSQAQTIDVSEHLKKSELKTINGESIIGTGDITITGSGGTGGDAKTIQVNLDDNQTANATITIKTTEPDGGNTGDIWFKYQN
jgi:hypothetical protein